MLIQIINITYHKDTRGAPYTSQRYRYACSLPDNCYDCAVSYSFVHQPEGFEPVNPNQTWSILKKIDFSSSSLRLDFGMIEKSGPDINVFYKYSPGMGLPERKNNRHEYLDEPAFTLGANEYGKLMYNGRFVYFEHCYYKFVAVNILNNSEVTGKNVFIKRKPCKIYKQLKNMF